MVKNGIEFVKTNQTRSFISSRYARRLNQFCSKNEFKQIAEG